ncbi:MAG: hypothetical protein HC898_04355 [Phycisphaerales bacterium]|nr:hypothetical protein [Phycisphaerales bacterium]
MVDQRIEAHKAAHPMPTDGLPDADDATNGSNVIIEEDGTNLQVRRTWLERYPPKALNLSGVRHREKILAGDGTSALLNPPPHGRMTGGTSRSRS